MWQIVHVKSQSNTLRHSSAGQTDACSAARAFAGEPANTATEAMQMIQSCFFIAHLLGDQAPLWRAAYGYRSAATVGPSVSKFSNWNEALVT